MKVRLLPRMALTTTQILDPAPDASSRKAGHLPGSGEAFGVGDATGCLALRDAPHVPALVAVAGGAPVDLFGLYDGFGLAPLALVAGGHLYAVPSQDPRPVLMRAA